MSYEVGKKKNKKKKVVNKRSKKWDYRNTQNALRAVQSNATNGVFVERRQQINVF